MKDFDSAAAQIAGRLGPTGIGTSAARFADLLSRARLPKVELPPPTEEAVTRVVGSDPAYALRPWGDGTASPLYCPVTERVNDALAEEVDRRLIAWAQACRFEDRQVAAIKKALFGRLVMLMHPDSDDPDRLLLAAQMNATWWAADDCYADDTAEGAVPTKLPPRLALVMAAMDPLPPTREVTRPIEEALRTDPILVGFRSGVEHMAQCGTPPQVQRVCCSTFAMFVSWTAYAAWR